MQTTQRHDRVGAERQTPRVEHHGKPEQGEERERREDHLGNHRLTHDPSVYSKRGESHERRPGVHDGHVHRVDVGNLLTLLNLLPAHLLHLLAQRVFPRVQLQYLNAAERLVLQLHAPVCQLHLISAKRGDDLEEILLQRDQNYHDGEPPDGRPADVIVQQRHVSHRLQHPRPQNVDEQHQVPDALRVQLHVVENLAGGASVATRRAEPHCLAVHGRGQRTLDADPGGLRVIEVYLLAESPQHRQGEHQEAVDDAILVIAEVEPAEVVGLAGNVPKEASEDDGGEELDEVVEELEEGPGQDRRAEAPPQRPGQRREEGLALLPLLRRGEIVLEPCEPSPLSVHRALQLVLEPLRVVAGEVGGGQREQVIKIELLLLQTQPEERGDPEVEHLADDAVFVTPLELVRCVPTPRPPFGRGAGCAPVVHLGDALILADSERSEDLVGDAHVRYSSLAPGAPQRIEALGGGSAAFHNAMIRSGHVK